MKSCYKAMIRRCASWLTLTLGMTSNTVCCSTLPLTVCRSDVRSRLLDTEVRIVTALVPDDSVDAASAVLEIRAGTGGREAALFAGDLLKMYQGYVCSIRGYVCS